MHHPRPYAGADVSGHYGRHAQPKTWFTPARMPSLCQMEPRVLTPYEHSVRAAGYGIPSRGPTRLLGNDVGPLSIWTKLNKGYALSDASGESKWNHVQTTGLWPPGQNCTAKARTTLNVRKKKEDKEKKKNWMWVR